MESRLGCKPNGEGLKDLMRHPWFKGIDWDALEAKELLPPFVPDVRKSFFFLQMTYYSYVAPLSCPIQSKKANFDSTHELEETVTRGQPSEASEKKSEPGHQQSHCGDATDGRTVSRALGFQFRFLICLQDLRLTISEICIDDRIILTTNKLFHK